MTGRLDATERWKEEERKRDFSLLSEKTLNEIRRLVRHPESALGIFSERLQMGCKALDDYESDKRYQLFEAILTAYRICQDALDEERCRTEAAEIWALSHDPERRAMRGRLRALNYRSGQEHLKHEQSGLQVPLPLKLEPEKPEKRPMRVVGRTKD